MIDLTGANLVNYVLRMVRDIMNRSPRYKDALGETTFTANTQIKWKDVFVSMTNVTTSGTRLSPNYFMCTQLGRAILAKVGDKDGQFIEWTREVDATRQTPTSGVYYINVDYFNDQTRDLGLTVQKYRWVTGNVKNAVGTKVSFRPGINSQTLTAFDQANGNPIEFTAYNSDFGDYGYLITPCTTLIMVAGALTNQGYPVGYPNPYFNNYTVGEYLTPLTDYWFERPASAVIIEKTVTGSQLANIPQPYVSFTLTDQDGYELRPGLDYTMQGAQWVQLSPYTPPGSTITANMIVKVNPVTVVANMPENYLQVGLQPGETLQPGQIVIRTSATTYTTATPQPDGTVLLPSLLQPGDCLRWDMRVNGGQVKATAKKWELTNLPQVDPTTIQWSKADQQGVLQPLPYSWVASADPSQLAGVIQTSAGTPILVNNTQVPVLPGLRLAIGDNVVVGDQAAIIVSPTLTETYEVFGSKENLTFTLEVKANDLQTASDLGEMLKRELLIMRRTNTEADGLTIFEISRGWVGSARDLSSTAPQYVYTMTVTASADWKVYIPLTVYLANLEITETLGQTDFLGKLQMAPRMRALGTEIFIPSYR